MADFEDTNEEEREISKCIPNRIVPNGSVLQNVPGFVARLNDLIRLAEKESFENSENSPLLEVCQELYHSGEAMAVSVDREVRRRLSVQEQCHATSDAFQLSLQRLVYLNKVCKELEEKVTQQQKQIDKTESNKRRRLKPAETKEPKHPVGGRMGISPHFSSAPPTSSQTLPARGSVRDVNTYEDFQKKVMPEILYASLPNQVTPSSAGTRVFGPVRKARSETDLRESELEKELKSMHVDNSRLRDSEKKLRKDNSQLQRKCKTLEKERDKAEDRLQVEQSNRDSLAKLRKRNEELEKQLKIICQEEVWKKRHQDVQDVLDSVTMDESKSVDQPLAVDSNDNSQAHLPPSQQ